MKEETNRLGDLEADIKGLVCGDLGWGSSGLG